MTDTAVGVVAEFGRAEDLVAALRAARAEGWRSIEAFSPYPVPEAAELLGTKGVRVAWIAIGAGLSQVLMKALGLRTTAGIGLVLGSVGMLALLTIDRDGSYLSDVLPMMIPPTCWRSRSPAAGAPWCGPARPGRWRCSTTCSGPGATRAFCPTGRSAPRPRASRSC